MRRHYATLSALFISLRLSNAKAVPYLEQSFFFQWSTTNPPVPVTTQCETISISWDRKTATGPNPTAPYYLQVYSSAYIFPFTVEAGSGTSFEFTVPFAPRTLYQICMFDKYGNTGGCEAVYSVVPSSDSQLSCSNSTLSFPEGPLDVDAQVVNGPISQYGWIPQCTDIMLTPRNGTPPYTFTAAPALHPPYNITSHDMSSINWTVSLSYASPFFISVVDAAGNRWSNGILHSGGDGPTSCLAPDHGSGLSTGSTVGVGVGGLVVGLLAGIAAAFLFYRHRRQRAQNGFLSVGSAAYMPASSPPLHDPWASSIFHRPEPSNASSTLSSHLSPSSRYQVEPFVLPNEIAEHRRSDPRTPTSPDGDHVHHFPGSSKRSRSPGTTIRQRDSDPSLRRTSGVGHGGQVYVVHHDGGRPPPVTVYHQDGTEIVELPPRYPAESGSHTFDRETNSEWDASRPLILP